MSFIMDNADDMAMEMGNREAKPHICIVGAGISGLRCAEVLLERGFRVTIFEARQRIGGRICQNDDLGFKIDMGANWIHTFGPGHGSHPILEIAREIGTRINLWHNENHFYDTDGKKIEQERGDVLMDLVQTIFDEAFAYSAKQTSTISVDQSMYDFVAARVKEVAAEKTEDSELLMKFADTWSGYVGQSIKKQGLKFAYIDECCGEEQYFVEDTYESILERVAKIPRKLADLQLGQKVTAIEPSEGVNGRVKVKTESGESYSFDEVVMTAPLGWLKKNKSIFTPALPPRLSQAIDSIGVANFEKVYISFPRAFWLPSMPSDPNPFTGFTEWFSPSYATSTNPHHHQIEAWSLASSSHTTDHRPTILFYTHGALAHYLTSTLRTLPAYPKASSHHRHPSPSRFISAKQAFLTNFFTPYFSLLPGYDKNDEGCRPSRIVATDWSNDELAGWGSFCNFPTGMRDAEGDVKALREGWRDRGVWFAGEHVAPVGELGTVTGAWLSGEEAGRGVCAKYRL